MKKDIDKPLNLEAKTINYCISLTIAQWEILCIREDYDDTKISKWESRFNVDRIDWNGHFGPYIFFTADHLAGQNFKRFLQRFLKIPLAFEAGVKDGENGAETFKPSKNSRYEYYLKGTTAGAAYGYNITFTKSYDDLRKA